MTSTSGPTIESTSQLSFEISHLSLRSWKSCISTAQINAHATNPTHTPADFTSFTRLHTLHIPSSAGLNQVDRQNQDRGMLWRLPDDHCTRKSAFLPPNLSHLTMHFAWPNTLFARGGADVAQFPLLPENVQIRRFE
jgi:hypothetical protein